MSEWGKIADEVCKNAKHVRRVITQRDVQLEKAKNLGIKAFHDGRKCAPIYDNEIMKMIEGRNFSVEIPDGEASTIEILSAWSKGWTQENLAAPVENKGD
jgi:hypothetical protein